MKCFILLCFIGLSFAFVHQDGYNSQPLRQQDIRTKENASSALPIWIKQRESNGQQHSRTDVELSAVCKDCQLFVRNVNNILKDGVKLERLERVLKMLCDNLPGTEKEVCINFFNNLPAFIHVLEALLADPLAVCQKTWLCGKQQTTLQPIAHNLIHIATQLLDEGGRNDFMCDECLFVTNEIGKLIGSKQIRDEVEKLFEDLCWECGTYKAQCKQMIDKFFAFAWDDLENLVAHPRGLCKVVGLCPGSRLPRERRMMFISAKGAPPSLRRIKTTGAADGVKMTFLCQVCTEVADYVDKIVSSASLQKDVDQILVQSCHYLPSFIREECKSMVEQYMPGIWQSMENEFDPKVICPQLHLCPAIKSYQAEDQLQMDDKSSKVDF